MSQLSRSPGFVLHGRRFRENSRILDVLTRDAGKIAVVARVSKKQSALQLSAIQLYTESVFLWRGNRDLQTLQSAEITRSFRLEGEKGVCGLYCNELLLYLSERHLPMPGLYDSYRDTLQALENCEQPAIPLRQFEASLLQELGLGLDCEHDGLSHQSLDIGSDCFFLPDSGFSVLNPDRNGIAVNAAQHRLLAEKNYTHPDVISVSRRLFGVMIERQLAGRKLKSRELMQSFYKYRKKS